ARLARVVQRQDVRMGEPGGDFDLPQEALGAERRGDLGPQHLDSNGAAVLEIARQVHRGHPAPPQLALEGVALGEGCAERLKLAGHRRGSALNRWRAAW